MPNRISLDVRHGRSHRSPRRAGAGDAGHQQLQGRRRLRPVGHHARSTRRQGHQLEDLPAARHLRRQAHRSVPRRRVQRDALLQAVRQQPEFAALQTGVPAELAVRVRARTSSHGNLPAVSWLLPPLGVLRAPERLPGGRPVLRSPGHLRDPGQSRPVVEDGHRAQLRRERRLLRPRGASDSARRHAW